ncbi:MAG TPA: type II and III secretion system protein family protein [Sphingobium sp.]
MTPMTLRQWGRAGLAASAALILTAAPAIPVLAAGGSQSAPATRDDGVILLSLGQSRVVNLTAAMSDVIIANPDVMDVHVRSTHQLYLIPKGPGQTDVTVTNSAGKAIYRAVVRVGNNLTSVDQMLRIAMPDADITITKMNNSMLLTGTVATPEDMAEAERLVGAFLGDKTTIISRLKTATPLAVNLQVRIAEVSKTISKTIGMNLASADLTSGFKFALGQGRAVPTDKWIIGGGIAAGGGAGMQNIVNSAGTAIGTGIASKGSGTTFATDGKLFGLNILAALDLAEDQGLATTLANPNLTALSGETASFLAGGELPIPLASGFGQVSVEFKSYGVSLAFTPTVLADGRISLRVRPEVSDLDYTAGVTISGTAVPGVKTRRAETTMELGSGQSFMIGGLLRSENSNSINKAPFLGDIPILGNLFKSTAFRRQQTELVIIVTPYLVKPVNARDIKLPTDGFRNANDAQRILGAMTHDSKPGLERPTPSMAPPVTVPAEAVSPVAASPATGGATGGQARKPGKANAAPGFSF